MNNEDYIRKGVRWLREHHQSHRGFGGAGMKMDGRDKMYWCRGFTAGFLFTIFAVPIILILIMEWSGWAPCQ